MIKLVSGNIENMILKWFFKTLEMFIFYKIQAFLRLHFLRFLSNC